MDFQLYQACLASLMKTQEVLKLTRKAMGVPTVEEETSALEDPEVASMKIRMEQNLLLKKILHAKVNGIVMPDPRDKRNFLAFYSHFYPEEPIDNVMYEGFLKRWRAKDIVLTIEKKKMAAPERSIFEFTKEIAWQSSRFSDSKHLGTFSDDPESINYYGKKCHNFAQPCGNDLGPCVNELGACCANHVCCACLDLRPCPYHNDSIQAYRTTATWNTKKLLSDIDSWKDFRVMEIPEIVGKGYRYIG